jgi:deoxyribose-phosphate aldolase
MLQPCWIPLAKDILAGTGVRIATAICYPMGGETLEMKLEMVRKVKKLAVDEFDFQPNIGFLKSGMIKEFFNEISSVVREAEQLQVKLMSEFGFLDDEEKKQCILLAEEAGVAYIKNSSGVGPGGSAATAEDILFIKKTVRGKVKIKASGQIRSFEQAVSLLDAGADLLGTSAGPEIIQDLPAGRIAY